jgi:hypothetical protein
LEPTETCAQVLHKIYEKASLTIRKQKMGTTQIPINSSVNNRISYQSEVIFTNAENHMPKEIENHST